MLSILALALAVAAPAADPAYQQAAAQARSSLTAKHGAAETARIERGARQVLEHWQPADGDPAAYRAFVEAEFLPQGEALDRTFERFDYAIERTGGYLASLGRDLRRGVDLEIGPMLPLDERLAAWDPGAHVAEDMFQTKIAFVALLNFPLTSLAERNEKGAGWSRRQWAETRLAARFESRVPAEVQARISAAYAEADTYISSYNIYMHHVLDRSGQRAFPAGMRLLSHWNLRDEIKARYDDPQGLAKQRLVALVMDRIVRQQIPAAMVNNPLLDWKPETGEVTASTVKDAEAPAGRPAVPSAEREPDTRYQRWLANFQALRLADPYSPQAPSYVQRSFEEVREIPEARVRALFEAVLASPMGVQVARRVEAKLGRRLEPFDMWYAGFKPKGRPEAELDEMTRRRYPTPEAYAKDMPRLFEGLGFSPERARFLAANIEVDPARGSGHASGGARRDDKAHLRTRVGKDGMDYKGYNIAVHEMGHNAQQVFSTITIDHSVLQGVPNTAFTEALAFVFQARDLELLGVKQPAAGDEDLKVLADFWASREIAAVALVDMAAWHWLYEHPQATPAQFREAVVAAAQDVWNRHFAEIFGVRDVALLAIYSHFIHYGLYTPDYPIGHLIAFQVKEHFAKLPGPMGPEFERICQLGSLTPDAWMQQAVGAPLSAEPLLRATEKALSAAK